MLNQEFCFQPVNPVEFGNTHLLQTLIFQVLAFLLCSIFLSNWSEIGLLPIITDLNLYGYKNIMSYIKRPHIFTPERFNSPSPHPHHNVGIAYDGPGHDA